MEDDILSSMCKDQESYCSSIEQERASQQGKALQRVISHDFNTYVHMVVPVRSHRIAVKVTLSPFSLDHCPGQTFFSSKLRYKPCCNHINSNKTTSNIVRATVQKVIDSYYRPVCWDYFTDQCCTLDPPPETKDKECFLVAKTQLEIYAGSSQTSLDLDLSSTIESTTRGPLIATENSSNQSPHTESFSDPAHSNSTDIVPPQDHVINNALDRGSCQTYSALQSDSRKRKRESGSKAASKRVSNNGLTTWLVKGIKDLQLESLSGCVALDSFVTSLPKDDPDTCAIKLWKWSDKLETTSKSVVWSTRFLSICCSMVGTAVSEPDIKSTRPARNTIRNHIGLVEIVNSIVNEMLPNWGDEAYLLYHIVAAKGTMLSNEGRRSVANRRDLVSKVVTELKNLPRPGRIEGIIPFNPPILLAALLPGKSHEDIYNAIGLPLAKAGRILGEISLPQLPHMANLCLQLKTDLEGNPTPPATPLVLQREHTIEEHNTDEANQYQSGVNFHQSLRVAPAETDYSGVSLTVAEGSTTITGLGTGSAGDCSSSHPTWSTGSLMLVEATGTGFLGGPGAETNKGKGRGNNTGINLEDPMLSNFSAKDWGITELELEVFEPLNYEQSSGPDAWQLRNYQPDGESDAFLSEPFPY